MSEQCKKDEKQFPYEITKVDKNTHQDLELFEGYQYFVKVGPKEWFFPYRYEEDALEYYNFKVRPDDVFIVTFPRSGTTLTQELVWLLLNNLNFETSKEKLLYERAPFLDFRVVTSEKFDELVSHNKNDLFTKMHEITVHPVKLLNEMKERRTIKTHLPFSLLPPNLLTCGAKVIYVARNPRDVIVSFYHLERSFSGDNFQGSFEQYYECFQNNCVSYTPYWSHIEEGWNKKNMENVCFIFYEEYIKDLRSTIEKVAKFLEKPLSGSELDSLEKHLIFKNFKTNKSVNPVEAWKKFGIMRNDESAQFVRQGKSGASKSYFTEKLNEKATKWINENMKKIKINFPE